LHLQRGSFVVDAGCGPGLWTPLLAQAIGSTGRILGVDISPEALVTAQRRSARSYRQQVQYKRASLEQLPIEYGSADTIFSANVSQYLSDPITTFAAMGRYLAPGGHLVIKDIDFGTMHFHGVNPALQTRVFQAREKWEQERVKQGYTFEDSWVGSKLANYLRAAGYENVQEKTYRIIRHFPLPTNFRCYLQGIVEWFVCEGAPFLTNEEVTTWLQCFFAEINTAFDENTFVFEETEFVVSGTWHGPSPRFYIDMQKEVSPLEESLLVTLG
jgi:ubiquinone/menaquinone biosynthesis C-methylase UbiE